ncbi:MAG TPA: methionine synthase [Nocardioidaceae bacterium]|nr:methionine synthase [Nocardioidaceae bacterium]
MTVASGIGSLPGRDSADYTEAVRTVFDETPDLPYLPELPGRGVAADMIGRALAVMSGLAADLQPAGWRLTDSPGVDLRRARSLLAQDLDAVEEQAQGFAGRFKIQVAGPWTMAASVERPRGDRVLADHGARRELAQALAEGLREHVADVRRRLPSSTIVVQVDEPALPAVMGARIPTASGFSRHRSVDAPEAAPALEWVFDAITSAGATPVAHCCAADVPISLLTRAGAHGVSVDLSVLQLSAYDDLAGVIEEKKALFLGVVPTAEPAAAPPTEGGLTERVLRLLDMLGFDPGAVGERLVITPSCGLAAASPVWAVRALALSQQVARNLTP